MPIIVSGVWKFTRHNRYKNFHENDALAIGTQSIIIKLELIS